MPDPANSKDASKPQLGEKEAPSSGDSIIQAANWRTVLSNPPKLSGLRSNCCPVRNSLCVEKRSSSSSVTGIRPKPALTEFVSGCLSRRCVDQSAFSRWPIRSSVHMIGTLRPFLSVRRPWRFMKRSSMQNVAWTGIRNEMEHQTNTHRRHIAVGEIQQFHPLWPPVVWPGLPRFPHRVVPLLCSLQLMLTVLRS